MTRIPSALAMALVALLATTVCAMPVPDILQLHMDEPLWDGTANEVVDTSGMAHHGTAIGDATTTLGGYFRRAGTFDRSAPYDYVTCGSASSLVPSNQITVEAWIRPQSIDTWNFQGAIVGRSGSYYLEIAPDKRIRSYQYYDPTGATGWLNGPDLSTYGDQWLHVVSTFDGTATTDNHAIWVNGERVAVQSVGSHDLNNPVKNTYIGYVDSSRYYRGLIDEVGIYSRVLTPGEIRHNANLAPLPDILDLQMNETVWDGTPNEVIDSSGSGHHGSIIGNPTTVDTGKGYFGRAGSFGGDGDSVNCSTAPSLVPPTAAITLDAWIKPDWDNWSQDGTIVTREHSYYLQVNSDGTLRAYFYPPTGAGSWLIGPDLEERYGDQWIHVAATWDGAVETLYVNGITEPGWSSPLVGTAIKDLIDPTEVGSMKGGRRFRGLIDRVGIFSWALSDEEVARRAYIPEPTSLLLLSAGLLPLLRRRKR